MNNEINQMRHLLNELRNLGLWGRIFHWNRIRKLIMDAGAELSSLQTNLDHSRNSQAQYEMKSARDKETILQMSNRKSEMDIELGTLRHELKVVQKALEERVNGNTRLVKEEEFRKGELSRSMSTLKDIRDQLEAERRQELSLNNEKEMQRIHQLKETWTNHEITVRQTIKSLSLKHGIESVDQVPFKGTPDNALKICEDYLIFDAKSPAGEDLTNFPLYLRDQSEKAVKYAREENVNKDIFFVVPSNTLSGIRQQVYRLASYNVFIIPLEALEPIMLAYRKLEAYEFAKQLSPEERENICRVLGKFAHLAKRRIQVDHFFIRQFMELAYKAETDLPAEILEQVLEFEKAEKLNPPTERRSKQISLKELEKDAERINQDTRSKGIAVIGEDISTELNKLPLYSPEIAK